MRRFVAFALGSFCSALLWAGPPPAAPWFESLRVADGLPSNAVYTLRQGADGYVWIGTQDGLARYDGVDFRIWRHDPDDSSSLASNDVSALLIDRRGRVWCGGEGGGLNELLPAGGFRHYRHDKDDPASLSSDDVFALAEDAGGEPISAIRCVRDNDLAGIFELATAGSARRQGHARAILASALKWARAQGARTAWLQVVATNDGAIALYRDFGFHEVYRYSYRGMPK